MESEVSGQIVDALKEVGVRLVVSLPDSWLGGTGRRAAQDADLHHVSVANEGDGVAICGGAWLGGTKAAMLMENTGMLVATYALTRFQLTFGIPTLMLVSYRGDFGDGNWWGSSVGRVTEPVLQGLGISYEVVRSPGEIPAAIRKADRSSAASLQPVAVLLGFGSVGGL